MVRISEPPDELSFDLWVLTHPDLRRTARVQALASAVYEVLGRHAADFDGRCAKPSTRRKTVGK